MTEKYAICTFPFDSAQISMQGDVFVCCPPWCNSYSFGNIYEQSFDEIWNGEKAKEFRRQFINENYNICNLDLCVKDCSHNIVPTEVVPKPKTFIFCYDSLCNVKCIFCRSCHQKQDLSYFDEDGYLFITGRKSNRGKTNHCRKGQTYSSFFHLFLPPLFINATPPAIAKHTKEPMDALLLQERIFGASALDNVSIRLSHSSTYT